jgi:hypothetical protein
MYDEGKKSNSPRDPPLTRAAVRACCGERERERERERQPLVPTIELYS